MKGLFFWLVFLVVAGASPQAMAFTDVCGNSNSGNAYCKNVGKHAFNAFSLPRDVDLGPITGVAWRPKGSVVSSPGHPVRLSPRHAFYYIIGAGGVSINPFIRQARNINPQDTHQK